MDPITASAAISGGASLIMGLMGMKAQDEQARKKAKIDAIQQAGISQQNAYQQIGQGQQNAFGQLMDSYRSALL